MTIIWNTDVNAPCCPGEIIDDETGKTLLIQTDCDYPGVASVFGWSTQSLQKCRSCGHIQTVDPTDAAQAECEECEELISLCRHESTDGTVDCPSCKITASDFIESAGNWLDSNDGATADDPGYFC